ncbi:HAAS signaling domain-containing protein [Paramaledivibacter caminithermalis]|jgi:uncharacterized membrane protein|uniref:Uncharacterized membrane protein n=1 Tax=Paramaledivibacter caminithermalis (strain DSM 15212 / CIP 107654 / DViRD3) TaxID=1121301 RepID=A0A1M6RPT0_PARC5|nr:DUF1700 domain-containing protein [Paramaledivibacter caminithermalis]SHK34469.1 Uncharacterized membrane protein [Paramaledivibacter caminithermalis DSM 15212]
MNKDEFLKELDILLNNLPSDEKREILFDYEEHFSIGLKEGKTEEEIIENLGSPKFIAKQYNANYMVNQAESNPSASNIFRAVFAIIVLGFFNLVFVLGPFIGIIGLLIGLFGASIGITIAGISLFGGIATFSVFDPYISLPIALTSNAGGTIFLGIGLTSLGLIFFIGNCYLAKWLYILTIKYLKFNLKIIGR